MMRYLIALFLLITAYPAEVFAGHASYLKTDGFVIKPDTTDTTTKKASGSIGISYGSDASFFGRTNETKFPFYTTDAIYNTKFGMFGYASIWKVFGSRTKIDEVDAGLGYSYKFSKKLQGAFSYTRFFFSDQTQILKSASSNDFNWKNTYDWKILKSGITTDYLFGKSSDFFVTVSNSHYFESSFGVFDNKDYLTFTPSFNMILGTQNFVQRFSQDHNFFGDLGPNPNNGNYVPPPTPPNEADYQNANRNFTMLDYNLRIPLAYNRPHYTIEASYKYSIPVNVQGFLQTTHQSFFNLTFYYVFFK